MKLEDVLNPTHETVVYETWQKDYDKLVLSNATDTFKAYNLRNDLYRFMSANVKNFVKHREKTKASKWAFGLIFYRHIDNNVLPTYKKLYKDFESDDFSLTNEESFSAGEKMILERLCSGNDFHSLYKSHLKTLKSLCRDLDNYIREVDKGNDDKKRDLESKAISSFVKLAKASHLFHL